MISIPEGMIDDRFAPAINKDIYTALQEAEGGKYPALEMRSWVHTHEVPDGRWGAAGRTTPLKWIVDSVAPGMGKAVVERFETRSRRRLLDSFRSGVGRGRDRFTAPRNARLRQPDTIVMGPTEAVHVDAQFTREQVEALADTIVGTGRRLQCDPGSSLGLNATAGRAGPEIAG